jgi:hypothetical protein
MSEREQQAGVMNVQDQKIVKLQLWLGFALIVIGGLIGAVFGVWMSDRDIDGIGLAMGTAVIGAGAVLLPGGAASAASSRILASLPDRSDPSQAVEVKTLDPDPAYSAVPDRAHLRGALTSPAGATCWFDHGASETTLGNETGEQTVAAGASVITTADATGPDARKEDRYYRLVAKLPSGEKVPGATVKLPKV